MNFKLEVIVLAVSDVDRAKAFYESLGWRLDADFPGDDGFRVIQLTPPGSEAAIIFGNDVSNAAPGATQGVDISEVYHDAGGVFEHAGTDHRVPGPDPGHGSYASFASFTDPDGNGWVLQEVRQRAPGR